MQSRKQAVIKASPVKKNPTKKSSISLPRRLGLPESTKVTLRYSTYFTLNPGAGTLGYQVFRTGSLYDPDYTGVGHQPLGFDQLASLYGRYLVTQSTIELISNNSYTTLSAIGVHLSDTNAPPDTYWMTLAEQSRASLLYQVGNASSTNRSPTVSNKYVATKFFGLKDAQDNQELGALCTANPALTAYFICYAAACDASVDPPLYGFVANLTFDCIFSDKVSLSMS